ncbi:MAG: hypothetical protein QXM53_07610 [Thermofilaceae archaeon]
MQGYLGLPREIADAAKALSKTMMERRLRKAEEVKPEAIKGEETAGVKLPRKTRKQRKRHLGKTRNAGQVHEEINPLLLLDVFLPEILTITVKYLNCYYSHSMEIRPPLLY